MTVENPTVAPRRYDPLLDEGRRPGKGLSTGTIVGIIISILLHVGLIYWLWKSKFQPHYQITEDTAVKVDLTKLAPPPPPPPRRRPHLRPWRAPRRRSRRT